MFIGLVGLLADTVLLIFFRRTKAGPSPPHPQLILEARKRIPYKRKLASMERFSKIRKGLKVLRPGHCPERQELVRKEKIAANSLYWSTEETA